MPFIAIIIKLTVNANCRKSFVVVLYVLTTALAYGQESVAGLRWNPFVNHKKAKPSALARTTAHTLTLPFFEDFTGSSIYPDSSKWTDYQVFVNNTMGSNMISKGVATFDCLNSIGIPYDSFSNTTFRYADSLTSQPIDLGSVTPSDSLYLSFFYQPQGNGYYPLGQDSLQLYLKTRYGGYVKVWTTSGTSLAPFRQVMLPITDTLFLHSSFQFRFVNIAALYWSDANWNVDYIRLNTNRSATDTAIDDVGFTSSPGSLLNDYTSMPYRQFYGFQAAERSAQFVGRARNNSGGNQTINYGIMARDLNTGSTLLPPSGSASIIAPRTSADIVFPNYTTAITPPGTNDKVVFENTFYMDEPISGSPTDNDTIVTHQVFDNYLAYDDGSAEKSYYLNLFPTLPGKIAVEYHLNQPDTLRGMAIYFGRQIPFANYKAFSIIVYSELAGINGAMTDTKLYQQDLYSPGYADTVNHFWIYTFNEPLVLPAGTFYAGTMQPAESGSDSLYIGLDVNRVGGNHAYYNVLSSWNPSLISGALMMRPILGGQVTGTLVNELKSANIGWLVYPNPATDKIQFSNLSDGKPEYFITDIQGRKIISGTINASKSVDISSLSSGIYFVNIVTDGIIGTPQKLIKL